MAFVGAFLSLALALGGCESSQEESAQLEASAKRERVLHPSEERGLDITSISREVRVVGKQFLHSPEGGAVVVALLNTSSHALRKVGIGITLTNGARKAIYANNAPGLEEALNHVSVLPPHQRLTWIDDQIPPIRETPSEVNVEVQDPRPEDVPIPKIALTGVHPNEEGGSSGIAGTVHNDSAVPQKNLVVYGLARRGAQVVAAGRALLNEVSAHGSTPFQVLLIGSAAGAKVEVSAPPSTL